MRDIERGRERRSSQIACASHSIVSKHLYVLFVYSPLRTHSVYISCGINCKARVDAMPSLSLSFRSNAPLATDASLICSRCVYAHTASAIAAANVNQHIPVSPAPLSKFTTLAQRWRPRPQQRRNTFVSPLLPPQPGASVRVHVLMIAIKESESTR